MLVLIVFENNRVTRTTSVTETIESHWTMGHKNKWWPINRMRTIAVTMTMVSLGQ